jgi:hypothetical protein
MMPNAQLSTRASGTPLATSRTSPLRRRNSPDFSQVPVLRCHVGTGVHARAPTVVLCRPASIRQLDLLVELATRAKVADFQIATAIQEYVVLRQARASKSCKMHVATHQFQISMANAPLVQIRDAIGQLPTHSQQWSAPSIHLNHEFSRFSFAQTLMFVHVVAEIACDGK